jgi:hypothetical protein
MQTSATQLGSYTYLVTQADTGLQIGYETISIKKAEAGYLLDSRHVLNGVNMPPQYVNWAVSEDWVPQSLNVNVEGIVNVVMRFDEYRCFITTTRGKQKTDVTVDVRSRQSYPLLQGVGYAPLHLLQRLRHEGLPRLRFDMVPFGLCEVARMGESELCGRRVIQYEAKLFARGMEDALLIEADGNGWLLGYVARNQKVRISLE